MDGEAHRGEMQRPAYHEGQPFTVFDMNQMNRGTSIFRLLGEPGGYRFARGVLKRKHTKTCDCSRCQPAEWHAYQAKRLAARCGVPE